MYILYVEKWITNSRSINEMYLILDQQNNQISARVNVQKTKYLSRIMSMAEISRDHRNPVLEKKWIHCAKDITQNHTRGWLRVVVINISLAM